VALRRARGLSVLVEGVETEHQRALLRLAGCDEMQGFLFAGPVPAKAIAAPGTSKAGRSASVGGGRGADSVTFRL
jgi:EAL domain-containing protein (putative c-di-GMP-specific phosphodiesterase class I)